MTVKTTLQKWRELFDWIDKHEARFCWILPRRSVELFSVEIKRIEDKDERDARANGTNVIVPTLTEIKTLMDAGNDYQRMLILTAICGSLGQAELSCLRRGEMDLSTGAMRHRRNKSGVEGLHFLPPELCKRLGDYFEENPTVDGLAFKTRQGSVLVSDTSDSVQQWFLDLRAEVLADEKNAGKIRPEISFYDFRRVLANHPLVQKKHLSETALSQTHKTVANQKYVPNRDVQQSELWKISQKRFIPELRVAGILD